LASCAPIPDVRLQTSGAAISPVEAIARSTELQGKLVRIKGYYTARTDTRALWQDKDARLDVEQERLGPLHKHNYWENCITVYPRKNLGITDVPVELEGRLVIIKPDDIRSFWTCNAVSIEDARLIQR
jgi:hypothetical protein